MTTTIHESTSMNQEHPTTFQSTTPMQFTRAIVESVVARHPGVTVEDVFGQSRKRPIVNARFEAIAEIVEARPHWSYPTVGRLFKRDHTSILNALEKTGRHSPRRGFTLTSHHEGLSAVASVSAFIVGYQAAGERREHRAALSVAKFIRDFALPAWARTEGGAQ